ncbi:MAG: ATP-dependent zinc metalloprotease FtsH [Alphaproteobacteria bacterium]|nr:MAG: ATP-dependent zinc metalloprotease FtsH [Alphaproteobacteria bacterium]
MEIKREHLINFWYVILAFLAVLAIQDFLSRGDHVETIPYSEFQRLSEEGKLTDMVVGPTRITGAYVEAQEGRPEHFSTIRVDPGLASALQRPNVSFSGEPAPGFFAALFSWFAPLIGFALIWMLLIRPMSMGHGAGGLMAIGKSKAKVYVEKDIKVTFGDVAGVDEAKEELKEIVSFLKDPKSYGRLGARVPRGVLLVGPPGTGKTLLARAVAGEAGVPFFSISGSEFVELFVGVGAARVRDLFEQARKQAPAIVFIDELDALGRARGSIFPGGGHDEKEQTLNQLLSELDGFDAKSGVVLLSATNRPEILDPALLRAGRFDRQILVDRPDRKGRIDILRVHLKGVKLASGLPVDDIAALTPGFTGADLANLVNEAALLATRRGAEEVALGDFTAAIERIVAGLEKRNRLLNPRERKIVAHHEMGHALVAMALPGVDPVQKVSIIPRGIGALGYTIQRPLEDRFLMDRSELANRMTVLLGGRAAESIVFGEISTGAADDLAKASEIARSMAVRYGMDERLGQAVYEAEPAAFLGPANGEWRPRRYSDDTAAAIDAAVRALVDQAFKRAVEILSARRALLDRAASALLEKETLSAEQLAALVGAPAPRLAEA